MPALLMSRSMPPYSFLTHSAAELTLSGWSMSSCLYSSRSCPCTAASSPRATLPRSSSRDVSTTSSPPSLLSSWSTMCHPIPWPQWLLRGVVGYCAALYLVCPSDQCDSDHGLPSLFFCFSFFLAGKFLRSTCRQPQRAPTAAAASSLTPSWWMRTTACSTQERYAASSPSPSLYRTDTMYRICKACVPRGPEGMELLQKACHRV